MPTRYAFAARGDSIRKFKTGKKGYFHSYLCDHYKDFRHTERKISINNTCSSRSIRR